PPIALSFDPERSMLPLMVMFPAARAANEPAALLSDPPADVLIPPAVMLPLAGSVRPATYITDPPYAFVPVVLAIASATFIYDPDLMLMAPAEPSCALVFTFPNRSTE